MDKNSYALGMSIAHNMLQSGVKEVAFEDFVAGLKATLTRQEPAISYQEAGDILDKYFQQLQEKQAAEQAEVAEVMKKDGVNFLAENAKKEGVVTTASGLQYKVITQGEGKAPKKGDTISVTYRGSTIDGAVFDEQKKPVEFPLDNMIPGWVEGIQLMKVGSEFELYIPSELGYGESAVGQLIKPNSVLIFNVKLVDVKEQKAQEPAKTETKAKK